MNIFFYFALIWCLTMTEIDNIFISYFRLLYLCVTGLGLIGWNIFLLKKSICHSDKNGSIRLAICLILIICKISLEV